ncbi:MAG: peptide ABC transporter substrate-binding protein [Lachnospiraceae bacterium]|nr:peptide ABC transporter substrate-binding protein [Lachnospiraceae bacterium]
MKKKLISILLVAAMALSLVACGGSKDKDATKKSSSESKKNTNKEVLSLYLASEPQHLDPALNSSVDGGCLAVNTFVGLYTYDKDVKLVPALADGEPEVSEDEKTYTFKLIQSKWSNGDDLTAKDFVYSWNRAIAEETAADYAYLFDIIEKNEDGTLNVTANDDYTLTIQLTSPCTYFLDLLAFPTFSPVHEASVVKADKDTEPGSWAHEAGFVCNGAYTLKEWKHDESMVYVKNDNYYDAENVTMPELHFMLSDDMTATYAAYNSGDLDFIDEVPTDEIAKAKESDEFHVIDTLGTYYVAFNVNSKMFEGKTPEQATKMRKAMSLMIDRQYIVDTVAQTDQKLANSFIPALVSDGNGGKFKKDGYFDAEKTGADNAKEAIKLLEECGYSFEDKGDGTYKISPALTVNYVLNTLDSHQKIAEAMQQDLAVLGIDMKISSEDWNVFLENRKQGNFDVAREGWLLDYDDPINMLEIFTSKSGNNDCQFGKGDKEYAPKNWDKYDELVNSIRVETDPEKRIEMMHEAEDMLMDTWAAVPIYEYNDMYMKKSNVEGDYANLFGMKYFMYTTKK